MDRSYHVSVAWFLLDMFILAAPTGAGHRQVSEDLEYGTVFALSIVETAHVSTRFSCTWVLVRAALRLRGHRHEATAPSKARRVWRLPRRPVAWRLSARIEMERISTAKGIEMTTEAPRSRAEARRW